MSSLLYKIISKRLYISYNYFGRRFSYDDTIVEREFNAFNNILDNYPKYVLSLDKLIYSQNGIIHKNVIDWLLDKEN